MRQIITFCNSPTTKIYYTSYSRNFIQNILRPVISQVPADDTNPVSTGFSRVSRHYNISAIIIDAFPALWMSGYGFSSWLIIGLLFLTTCWPSTLQKRLPAQLSYGIFGIEEHKFKTIYKKLSEICFVIFPSKLHTAINKHFHFALIDSFIRDNIGVLMSCPHLCLHPHLYAENKQIYSSCYSSSMICDSY